MAGPAQLDPGVARAFAKAFSDPTVLQAVEEFLQHRKATLQADLNASSRRALFDEKAKPFATVLLGQLHEINSWLEIVARYIETGDFDVAKLKTNPFNT